MTSISGRTVVDTMFSSKAALLSGLARMGAERLLSQDMNHGQMIAGVRIVNPFESG